MDMVGLCDVETENWTERRGTVYKLTSCAAMSGRFVKSDIARTPDLHAVTQKKLACVRCLHVSEDHRSGATLLAVQGDVAVGQRICA